MLPYYHGTTYFLKAILFKKTIPCALFCLKLLYFYVFQACQFHLNYCSPITVFSCHMMFLTGCGMFRMWNAWEVGCLGCEMPGKRDFRDMKCSRCGMWGMWRVWDVWDVECSGCEMFEMWNVRDVECGIGECVWSAPNLIPIWTRSHELMRKTCLKNNISYN